MNAGAAPRSGTRSARVAILSDIHANLPALAAALRHAERLAGRIMIAGDIVGGGPHPAEVVRVLRERGEVALRGNVDRKVLARALERSDRGRRAARESNAEWSAAQLGPEEVEWLADLPTSWKGQVNGHQLLVVHGSPQGDTDGIFPSITRNALAERLGELRPDILVAGHTHLPFARRIDDTLVVNCGSVGRPYDGDARGSFVVVDAGKARASARVLRFAYDVEAVVTDASDREVPGINPEVWRLGVKKEPR